MMKIAMPMKKTSQLHWHLVLVGTSRLLHCVGLQLQEIEKILHRHS